MVLAISKLFTFLYSTNIQTFFDLSFPFTKKITILLKIGAFTILFLLVVQRTDKKMSV